MKQYINYVLIQIPCFGHQRRCKDCKSKTVDKDNYLLMVMRDTRCENTREVDETVKRAWLLGYLCLQMQIYNGMDGWMTWDGMDG